MNGRRKNRARDYYDVYQLVRKYRAPEFYHDLRQELPKVFRAKQVDLRLLLRIFDQEFVAFQAGHFASVEATVKGRIEPFWFYSEQLRLLLNDAGLYSTLEIETTVPIPET